MQKQNKAPRAPTWAEISGKHWKDIESRYEAGNRSKEIVCAWITHSAARKVAKGRNDRDSYHSLISVGYAAACSKYDSLHSGGYDPAKDRGGGIDGALLRHAEGYMR